MNTPIDPPRFVVGTAPRHTEAADTRLGIHHHDEQQSKKKDDDGPEDLGLTEDVYDQATLGVQALIDFLKNFLRTLDMPERNNGVTPTAVPDVAFDHNLPAPDAMPVVPHETAARAASAYGHAAAATRVSPGSLYGGDMVTAAPDPSLIHSGEVRDVHILLNKLAQLDARGVVGVKLEKADTFLHSITNAVDLALAE